VTGLQRIKLVHTIVWVFFVTLIAHIVYAGWTDAVTGFTWTAIGFVFLEGLVLLLNSGRCPLTNMAEKYAPASRDNFDIYLPNWLAKHNVVIFTTIFLLGLGMVIFRSIE